MVMKDNPIKLAQIAASNHPERWMRPDGSQVRNEVTGICPKCGGVRGWRGDVFYECFNRTCPDWSTD